MAKLSVNVNKIATLRNSRGGNNPDLLQCTRDLIDLGAEGITVHPRPDERHIRKQDVLDLAELLQGKKLKNGLPLEFNIEGFPSRDYLSLLGKVRPHQATLVPDPPEALTSNAGWKLATSESQLRSVLSELRSMRIRSSLFIDPFDMDEKDFDVLDRLKPDRVELYTQAYAEAFKTPRHRDTTKVYQLVAEECVLRGVGVNAGHDLDSQNLPDLIRTIPVISEVSIGHALICDALYLGFAETMKRYLAAAHTVN